MKDSDQVPRRSFFSRLAAVGATIAGATALPSLARAQTPGRETHPADAWLDDFKGQHKVIYDCTTPQDGGTGWSFARNFLTANTGPIYSLKDEDLNLIVSVRHLATGFGFNDDMWAKYKLGEVFKVNDGSVPATRNPNTRLANDMATRGVITTVCGLATARYAGQVARSMGLNVADVEADLRSHLITPTARMVAAGVVIVNRAQEKGFSYTFVG